MLREGPGINNSGRGGTGDSKFNINFSDQVLLTFPFHDKHFWILAGIRKCGILIGLCK